MIVVNIEMWPKGDESKKRPIGRIVIINEGSGDVHNGNYNAILEKTAEYAAPENVGKAWKRVTVEGFDRIRRGPYDLLYQVLKKAVAGRN